MNCPSCGGLLGVYALRCQLCGAAIPKPEDTIRDIQLRILSNEQYLETACAYRDKLYSAIVVKKRQDDDDIDRQSRAVASVLEQKRSQAEMLYVSYVQGHPSNADRQYREQLQAVARTITAFQMPLAVSDWSSWDFSSVVLPTAGKMSSAIRAGTFLGWAQSNSGLAECPALVPLLSRGHIFVSSEDSDEDSIHQLVTSLVLRATAAAPAGQIAVTVFDPAMTAAFAPFDELRRRSNVLNVLEPTANALEVAMSRAIQQISDVSASLQSKTDTLADLIARTGQQEYQYQLIVLLNAPDRMSAKAADLLKRILERGARCGVSVIIHHDPAAVVERGSGLSFDPNVVTHFHLASDGNVAVFASWLDRAVDMRLDPQLPSSSLDRACVSIAESARVGALPTIEFGTLVGDVDRWSKDARNGIDVSLGKSGINDVVFRLGDDGTNLHNILVGGAVGTGKSNLLLAMIYSIAHAYPPDEVQFLLLDFKRGIEFTRFAAFGDRPDFLPHASVVSIECDQSFGLSTLRYLIDELEKRSRLFRDAGAVKLSDYRDKSGAPMPRLILVVDEFQGLFDGPANLADQAASLLQTVSRQGRAYGVHVVLASQTLSGIQIGTSGDKNAIFGQFPVRLALKMSGEDSQIVLGAKNDRAADLRYRGQAILNTAYGRSPDENNVFTVAYARDNVVAEMQSDMYAQTSVAGPRVYQGSQAGDLRRLFSSGWVPSSTDDEVNVWLGESTGITVSPVTAELDTVSGRNILVVGEEILAGVTTIQLAALSMMKFDDQSTRFIVCSGLGRTHQRTANIESWIEVLQELGASVQLFERSDGFDALVCAEEATTCDRTILITFNSDRIDFTTDQPGAKPFDILARILKKGPGNGTHTFTQWTTRQTIRQLLLGQQIGDMFRLQVFTGATLNEIQDGTGAIFRQPITDHRAIFAHGSDIEMFAPVPPMTDDDLDYVVELEL